MVIEQTVEIPANRRLTLEVPKEVPAGRAKIVFFPVPATTGKSRELIAPAFIASETEAFKLSPEKEVARDAIIASMPPSVERDKKLFELLSDELNREAADVLEYLN